MGGYPTPSRVKTLPLVCSYTVSMGVEGGFVCRSGGYIFGTLNQWFIGQVIDNNRHLCALCMYKYGYFVDELGLRAVYSGVSISMAGTKSRLALSGLG